MKRILFPLLIVAALSGCDKIDIARQTGEEFQDSLLAGQRKVLLEDYTGHYCGNCPRAADVADALEKKYGKNIVVMAVHAGFFADKHSGYTANYKTPAGSEWRTYYGITEFPNGIINRKSYEEGGSPICGYTKWETVVPKALKDTYWMSLNIDARKTGDSTIAVNVKGQMAQDYPQTIKISVMLLEDSIIGKQLDYRSVQEHNTNYEFKHMLRASLNGTWGDVLKVGPVKAKEEVSFSVSNFRLKAPWRHHQLSVVAFAFDEKTREVLQVEKVHLVN